VTRVLIVDDHAVVRDGLRALLERQDDLVVCGEAADGAAAIELAMQTQPDVVLMDLSLPGLSGLEAARAIVDRVHETHVLILTTFETEERIFDSLRAGASGYLLKDCGADDLMRAVRIVARGDALLSPRAIRQLVEDFALRPENRRASPDELEWLTDREREVMALVAAGLTNDEIADRLVISTATAKTHVSRTMRKLHCHDRAQLVVLAYETGLVVPARRYTDVSTGRLQLPAARVEGRSEPLRERTRHG
jgi:DNA-binding NarL/FixJ family response regulator